MDNIVVDETGHEEKKSEMKDYFEYIFKDKLKYGNCKICGKNEKGEYLITIKMKDSNTSGVKNHLKKKHLKEYEKIFPTAAPKSQNKLDSFRIRYQGE